MVLLYLLIVVELLLTSNLTEDYGVVEEVENLVQMEVKELLELVLKIQL